LKPWATRPFELIVHGEVHFRKGSDYDRRLALVSFDNAVEVAVATFLTLKPIQRGDRQYAKNDVSAWLKDYHTKLDFFLKEIRERKLPEHQSKDVIAWYHQQRNEQYHGGSSGVPEQVTLDGIRQSAFWVFSVLFEVADVEEILEEEMAKRLPAIPKDLVVPDHPTSAQRSLSASQEKALAAASLLGQWSESSGADLDMARRLADEF
jgi:hypothetical protein